MNRYRLFEAEGVVKSDSQLKTLGGATAERCNTRSPRCVAKEVLMSIGFSEDISEVLLASWMTASHLKLRGGFEDQSLCEMVDMTSFGIARAVRESILANILRFTGDSVEIITPSRLKETAKECFDYWESLCRNWRRVSHSSPWCDIPPLPVPPKIRFSLGFAKEHEFALRMICVPLMWTFPDLCASEIIALLYGIFIILQNRSESSSRWIRYSEVAKAVSYSRKTISDAAKNLQRRWSSIVERRIGKACYRVVGIDNLFDSIGKGMEEWHRTANAMLGAFSRIQTERQLAKRLSFSNIAMRSSLVDEMLASFERGELKGGFLLGNYDFPKREIIIDEYILVRSKMTKRTHFAYEWDGKLGYHSVKRKVRRSGKWIVAEFHFHTALPELHASDIEKQRKLASRYSGGTWVILSRLGIAAMTTYLKGTELEIVPIDVRLH